MAAPAIRLFLNGEAHTVANADPDMTLLQFIRSHDLTGTKSGCGAGLCGACTVMLSHFQDGRIIHRSVNSCYLPLTYVDGMAVTTIEALQSKGLHPIQSTFAAKSAAQCGFCTPGMIMAFYTFLRNNPKPTAAEIEDQLDGNLCRCTGYRPILDAMKTFSCGAENCCGGSCGTGGEASTTTSSDECASASGNADKALAGIEPYWRASEHLIFPPSLKTYVPESLHLQGQFSQLYRPVTLDELLALRSAHPTAPLVAGHTNYNSEVSFMKQSHPVRIDITRVKELYAVHETDTGLWIGSSTTHSAAIELLHQQAAKHAGTAKETAFVAIARQLKAIATTQIRNVAAIGSNIVVANANSDLTSALLATRTTVRLRSASGTRELPLENFLVDTYRVALNADEILDAIHIPFTREYEFVETYKISRRPTASASIVSCGLRMLTQADGTIVEAALAFAGVGAIPKRATETEHVLHGARLGDAETLSRALTALARETELPEHMPATVEGLREYRHSLAQSLLFKFYHNVAAAVDAANALPALRFPPREREVSSGSQTFEDPSTESKVVHHGALHLSGQTHVAGESKFTADIEVPRCKHAALVASTIAHGKLLSVDASKALAVPGVVAFISAQDVPGSNVEGAFADEQVFATNVVRAIGQPIGLIVADTAAIARHAAKLVDVQYEPLPAIVTIQDAIAAGSFYEPIFPDHIERGDIESGFAHADHVVEGEFSLGGQEHFYMETHAALVVPRENAELDVYATTQDPNGVQGQLATVLKLPRNKIAVKVKRLGGGFGGKCTRHFVPSMTAVAAARLRLPVKLVLDRVQDLTITGNRAPYWVQYKAGCNKDGKIVAMDLKLYSNAGYAQDFSVWMLNESLAHLDNAYYIPNIRGHSYACKTNITPMKPMRGAGGPEGIAVGEMLVERLARAAHIPSHIFKERNLYQRGLTTHYGQELADVENLHGVWNQCKSRVNLDERVEQATLFNEQNRYRKRGVALMPVKVGLGMRAGDFMFMSSALVHLYTDGTVLVTHGGVEMGQGLQTKCAQIAAETLGVPLENVLSPTTDTLVVANAQMTGASFGSDIHGPSVRQACLQILENLRPLREKMPDATIAELATAAFQQRIGLTGSSFYRSDFDSHKRHFLYYSYGAAFSEVEIDVLTGEYQVLESTIVMDVGKSLNPTIDVGQVEGGFIQGMGWFTTEELEINDDGSIKSIGPKYDAYDIPHPHNIPRRLNVSLLEGSRNECAIHSSKAIGEPPLNLGLSVALALNDAVVAARRDVGLSDEFVFSALPATVERVHAGCGGVSQLASKDK